MSNPAPVLDVTGTVHAVVEREVPAAEARPAEYDPETNRLVRPAMEARKGYTNQDVTLLTADGGFATVVLMPDALAALGGELPEKGSEVTYPVRCFVAWGRRGTRSYNYVGFSAASDVIEKRAAKPAQDGRRAASPVAAVS